MIFKIDGSVFSALKEGCVDSGIFLDDLCGSSRKGCAVFLIKKKYILELIDTGEVTSVQKGILKKINSMMTYSDSLESSFKNMVVCYHSGYPTDVEVSESDFDISNYQADSLEKYSLITTPVLVMEDLVDDLVYRKIADWAEIHLPQLSGLRINYIPRHSGGSRLWLIAQDELATRDNVFAICDSDKKSPYCNYGETANNAIKVFQEKELTNNCYILEVHEVENLIPHKILRTQANQSQLGAVDFLEYLAKNNPDSCGFYDLKETLTHNFCYESEGAKNEYWRSIVERYYADQGKDVPAGCISNSLSSMVSHAMKRLKNTEIDQVELTPPIDEAWKTIGTQMSQWFVSCKPFTI